MTPVNTFYDLDKPLPKDAHGEFLARPLRAYARYFNARYQTFGRRVHLYLYFNDLEDYYSPEGSTATAKALNDALHPFAVVVQSPDYSSEFAAALARRGVAVFTTLVTPPEPAAFYHASSNLLWGFWPSIEAQADGFATYVCRKVVGNPTVMSGNLGQNGKPRRIAILHGYFRDTPDYLRVNAEVRRRIEDCGGTIVDDGEFGIGNGCHTRDYRHLPAQEAATIARFKAKGVTTVLWTMCVSSPVALAAVAEHFHPEWIVMGDNVLDGNSPISYSGLSRVFDGHAIVVTPNTIEPPLRSQRCYQALHSVDAGISDFDAFWTCRNYSEFRQLFSAIQLAGSRLGPASIGRGTRSLPPVESDDPLTPTCAYVGSDTTCVKDAMAMYWDAAAPTVYNQVSATGCWRALEGGRRYLPGAWPAGNIDSQRTGQERCNNHMGEIDGLRPPDRYHVTYPLDPLIPVLP